MDEACYLFGAYRFEPAKGVFRGDTQIALPPKEMALLRLLVSLEGRIASHELIEATLWPRQVVSYASLARCVHSLRKHLESEDEKYIQTVPKRGYRLALPLKKGSLVASSSARAAAIQTTPLVKSHFLQGLREANNPDADSAERAIHWFQEALKLDPEFASAHAAIADIRVWQVARGYVMPMEGLKMAWSDCQKALRYDPSLVTASATQAFIVAILDRTPDKALALLDEALTHDPDYARGYTYRYLLLRMLGRVEEMLEAARHAIELDPHSLANRHSLSWGLYLAGRAEEALAVEREIHFFYPKDHMLFENIAVYAAHLGRYEEAVEAAFEALRLSEGNPSVKAMVAPVFADAGETGEAEDLVRQAESAIMLPRAPKVTLASAYLALGNRTYALELLERARAEHCIGLPLARLDPRFAPLADEPRFLALFE